MDEIDNPVATDLESVHFPSPRTIECPYPLYDRLRADAPVFKVPRHDIYLLTRYADVVWASKHPELFSSHRGAIGAGDPELEAIAAEGYPQVATMTQSDPPEHGRFRSILGSVFTPRRVAGLEPRIREITHELIDDFADRGEVEFAWEFANPIPMIIMADFLAVPLDRLRDFKRWAEDITQAKGFEFGLIDRGRAEQCQRSLVEFQHYFAEQLDRRRRDPGPDMISDLVRVQVAGERPLTLEEQLDLLRLLVIAGNETTAHLIINVMYLMLQSPHDPRELVTSPAALSGVIEEALRFESPSQWNQRMATRDVQLHGVTIPAGARVLLSWGAANRDETVFADASVCDFARPGNKQHVAFGHGIHYCLGAPLARLEARVAFECLYERLDGFALAAGRNDFSHIPNPSLRSLNELHLTFQRVARPAIHSR
jgi:cytochrome P450